MTHLQKLTKPSILKRISSNFVDRRKTPSCPIGSLLYIVKNTRFYGIKPIVESESCVDLDKGSIGNGQRVRRTYCTARRKAQAALLEYLHSTRGLQYMDAENISKNSPYFLCKLLEKVDTKADVGESITRFLRYHPINEFEPFFESLGLKPNEYRPLLPHHLMFLSDDDLLLENYRALHNYGVATHKMGKMYKEAMEIFRYDYGVLKLKLQAYEEFRLSQSFIARAVVFCPHLLVGGVNVDFIKVLEILQKGGIQFSWLEEHLPNNRLNNWSRLLALLNLFGTIGYREEKLGELINQHPGILFESSGERTLVLIGFLLKFGSTMNQIGSMLQQFPQTEVRKFVANLRQCFLFLNEIEMELHDIGKIVRSYPLLLGSCRLKKTNTLLVRLNVGKKRLCKFVQENPQEMRKWVMGTKPEPFAKSGRVLRSKMLKTNFLLDLGFVENSDKMEKVLKSLRGRAAELQERFDCFVKAGLDRKDVCEMIRKNPKILNLTTDVVEMKINFLVNGLGYPISYLVTFPTYFCYTIQRVEHRVAMNNWLKDQGATDLILSLSTLIVCSDKMFVERFVKHYPRGLEVWQNLKKKIYSE